MVFKRKTEEKRQKEIEVLSILLEDGVYLVQLAVITYQLNTELYCQRKIHNMWGTVYL